METGAPRVFRDRLNASIPKPQKYTAGHVHGEPRKTQVQESAREQSESNGRFPWKELGAGSGPAFPGQSSAPATGALDTPPSPAQRRGWEHGDADMLPPPGHRHQHARSSTSEPSTCLEAGLGTLWPEPLSPLELHTEA